MWLRLKYLCFFSLSPPVPRLCSGWWFLFRGWSLLAEYWSDDPKQRLWERESVCQQRWEQVSGEGDGRRTGRVCQGCKLGVFARVNQANGLHWWGPGHCLPPIHTVPMADWTSENVVFPRVQIHLSDVRLSFSSKSHRSCSKRGRYWQKNIFGFTEISRCHPLQGSYTMMKEEGFFLKGYAQKHNNTAKSYSGRVWLQSRRCQQKQREMAGKSAGEPTEFKPCVRSTSRPWCAQEECWSSKRRGISKVRPSRWLRDDCSLLAQCFNLLITFCWLLHHLGFY